jgi:hypothetical protein
MNDQTIISNTHFETDGDRLICYTVLPDGDRFEQQVSSQEAVQKNMIGWCNTVREFMKAKETALEEERIAAKRRKKDEESSSTEIGTTVPQGNAKEAVIAWYENTQARIDELSDTIKLLLDERDALRDERDKIRPIIEAWKGVKGEENPT